MGRVMRFGPIVVAFALSLSACTDVVAGTPEELAERRIRVVATTGMVADAVRVVGGDRLDVSAMMGPGIDPHLYKASERDVITIAEADAIFYNGLHLEARMADVFEKIAGSKHTTAVAEAIDPDELITPPEFEGAFDPHVWFDVELWMQAVENVIASLTEIDPAQAGIYRRNGERYLDELQRLESYVNEQVERVPPDRRVLITAHDAFNYFGQAYGFDVRALQGISTASEAGAAEVRELAEFIAARRIPAVFVETSVPTRFITAVQEAVRARGFDVRIGGHLFSDALGDPDTPEGTYVGMVEHNVDVIVGSLLEEGS